MDALEELAKDVAAGSKAFKLGMIAGLIGCSILITIGVLVLAYIH